MAGIKGKSGGARINSGGARPGAGRPRNPPVLLASLAVTTDSKAFLLALMNDSEADIKLRLEAAKYLMPYQRAKAGEAGKKTEQTTAAKKAARGKYAPSQPPVRLVR